MSEYIQWKLLKLLNMTAKLGFSHLTYSHHLLSYLLFLYVCVNIHSQGVSDTLPAVRLQPSVAAALDQREEHCSQEHQVLLPPVSPGPAHYLHQARAPHMR